MPPTLVPHRLGSLLIVLNNLIACNNALPTSEDAPWLFDFLIASFVFNVVAFLQYVLVSYGLIAHKWYV